MATTGQAVPATNFLASLLPQKAGTETTTSTEQTNLTPEAIDEIIRNMMESDSGLAAILQNQAGKGLYNSTTAQLLANDLAARVAGKAALASAPTTRTQSTKSTMAGKGGGVDPKYALGLKLLEGLTSKFFGQQPMVGGQNQANAGFQGMLDQLLGRKKGAGTQDSFSGGGFNPVESAMMDSFFASSPLGFTGGGGVGSFGNFQSTPMMDFGFGGSGGGFGSGGFDNFSFGLGGGGYSYDPFSLTAGGNFSLGNSFMSPTSSFANDFASGMMGGGFSGSSNSFNWGPVDYGFGGGFSSSWL
jgi:hypothetical protein